MCKSVKWVTAFCLLGLFALPNRPNWTNQSAPYRYPGSIARVKADNVHSIQYVQFVDNKNLILGFFSGAIHKWKIGDKESRYYQHFGSQVSQYVYAGGKRLLALHKNGEISMRDLETWETIFSISLPKRDGSFLASNLNGKVFALRTLENVQFFGDDGKEIWNLSLRAKGGVALDNSGKLAVVVVGKSDVRLYDIRRKKLLRENLIGLNYATPVAISPDGNWIVTGGEWDWPAAIVDIRKGRLGPLLDESRFLTVAAISPTGKRIAAGFVWGLARVYSASSGKIIQNLSGAEGGSQYAVPSVAFSKDGKLLAVVFWEGAVAVYPVR
jgi:WD40 repeat protein